MKIFGTATHLKLVCLWHNKAMERLDNYSIALCLYLLEGKVLSINTTIFETLPEDLHDYFDLLRYNLGAEQPKLFKLEYHQAYCDVLVEDTRSKELKELLTKYVDVLIKDKLTSKNNVYSWKNELKAFINKAKSSDYNLKSYNVTVEDMHVVLFGLMQDLFKLQRIDITPDEVVPCFYHRDTSGDTESGDISKFHECLKVSCTLDVSNFINKQDNTNSNNISGKTLALYKYIRKKSGGIDCEISLEELIGSKEDNKSYQTYNTLREAILRINNYYKEKYNTTELFVSKIKNGKTSFSCNIKYARNDDK